MTVEHRLLLEVFDFIELVHVIYQTLVKFKFIEEGFFSPYPILGLRIFNLQFSLCLTFGYLVTLVLRWPLVFKSVFDLSQSAVPGYLVLQVVH